jgi:hypothetical protein
VADQMVMTGYDGTVLVEVAQEDGIPFGKA